MDSILPAQLPAELFPIAAVFLLAGVVKGVLGLGLPTVAVGLLGIWMAPRDAAALLIVPSFVTNVWQLAAGPAFMPLLRRLWPMLAAICLGTLAGGLLLPVGSAGATAILGGALALYAVVGLARWAPHVPARAERVASLAAGAITGLVTAATGVFVIPAVPFLQGLRLERDLMVQALGLAFTASTVALAATLLLDSGFHPQIAGLSLYALLSALAGMRLGGWIRNRMPVAVFRRVFFLGLLILGLDLMFRHH